MELSIIIVNHDNQDHLLRCLDSVYKNTPDLRLEIIVIDNNSQDQSLSLLETYFQGVKIIKNERNFGFAKAANQGIRQSTGNYILCLNNDTVVLATTINSLLNFMNSHVLFLERF